MRELGNAIERNSAFTMWNSEPVSYFPILKVLDSVVEDL